MIINVKYDIGDTIRYIEKKRNYVYGSCPCCNKTGEITGADGEKYECPNCKGSKKVCKGITESEEEKTGTIKTINVSYDSGMECYHGKSWIYYTTPHSSYHIMQEDIIEKIVSDQDKLAYSD